jgi:hypothetical protein
MSHLALQKVIKSRPAASLALERDVGGGEKGNRHDACLHGAQKNQGMGSANERYSYEIQMNCCCARFGSFAALFSAPILAFGILKPTKIAKKGNLDKNRRRGITKTGSQTFSSMHS